MRYFSRNRINFAPNRTVVLPRISLFRLWCCLEYLCTGSVSLHTQCAGTCAIMPHGAVRIPAITMPLLFMSESSRPRLLRLGYRVDLTSDLRIAPLVTPCSNPSRSYLGRQMHRRLVLECRHWCASVSLCAFVISVRNLLSRSLLRGEYITFMWFNTLLMCEISRLLLRQRQNCGSRLLCDR